MWWSTAARSRPVQPAITSSSSAIVVASARAPCQRITESGWPATGSAVVAAVAELAQPDPDQMAALVGRVVVEEGGAAVADLEIVDVLDLAARDQHLGG